MPPHVIHVVISLAHGGLERLVVDWTNSRNRDNPGSTSICCLDELGELAAEVDGNAAHALAARRSRFPYDRAAVENLCSRAAVAGDGAVLHSHNLAAQQYAALAREAGGFRHVYTQHGANIHNQSFLNRLRSRYLLGQTDAVVGVAENTADAMRDRFGIPADRIQVIPNGVDMTTGSDPLSRRDARSQLNLSSDAVVVGSIGRLDRVKGYDRLIGALPELCAETDVVLVLIGDGPERTALQDQAEEAGVADRVVFAGFRNDARRYLPAFDLFVLPSRNEGLSIALLEAMAAGVPVLATDVGDNVRVMDHGQAGAVLGKDETEWPSRMRSTLQNADTVRETACRAQNRVAEHFSMRSTLRRYEQLYRGHNGS